MVVGLCRPELEDLLSRFRVWGLDGFGDKVLGLGFKVQGIGLFWGSGFGFCLDFCGFCWSGFLDSRVPVFVRVSFRT